MRKTSGATMPAPSTPAAYLFLMASLLFGFPLLTAYYNVDAGFYLFAIIPYLLVSIVIAFFIIRFSRAESLVTSEMAKGYARSDLVAKFNSFPAYGILILVAGSMITYSYIRFLVLSTYPFAAPEIVTQLGEFYILILIVTSILAFTRILYRFVPALRKILQKRKYLAMALVTSVSFATVYMLLVNQLIVSGFNALGTVSPPGGSYPFLSAMVPGVREPLIDLVYLPIVIVQISSQVNIIAVPFEMVFVIILSLLVSSNIVMAHYLISNSSLRCSTKGTLMSTSGSILGLTATCPTCLAPTFISVIFGGVTAAAAVYSNVYGVVLPPVLSVATLIVSIVYLTKALKNAGLI